MELVKRFPCIDIVLIFFSDSDPSGILGTDGGRGTAWASAGGVRVVALSISSHEQTQ